MELIYLGLLLFLQLVSLDLVFSQQKTVTNDFFTCNENTLDLIRINLQLDQGEMDGGVFNGHINYSVPLDRSIGIRSTTTNLKDEFETQTEYFENGCEFLLFLLKDVFILTTSKCISGVCFNRDAVNYPCPLEKGIYEVHDLKKSILDQSLSASLSLEKGDWKLVLEYIKDDRTVLGCFGYILSSI